MICEAVIIIGERIIQLMVREARKEDLDALLKLYLFLHEDSIPELNAHLEKTAGYNSSDKTAFIQWIGMDK